jgi:hypothetical protein
MSAGARPPNATSARVRVLFDGVLIGDTAVGGDFESYVFAIPPALTAAAAASNVPATLRLESTVWSPRELLGEIDTRELGVMMDTVAVR